MSAPIEVLEVQRVSIGSLKAFARVKLGCIIVHGVRVIEQEGQKAWVALPQVPARKKAGDGGGSGWFPVVEIDNPEVLKRMNAAVLAEWRRGR
jgi:hypothetical protein